MDESRKLHNRDRLSELPESLITAILSLLRMDDAVRTTVHSKSWIDLWTTVPSLNFWVPEADDLDRYQSFVYGALLRWKGAKILRFSLPFYSVIPHSRDLNSWLLFAIGKQVEELRLFGGLQTVDSYYCPPQRLYSCSSIWKLTLSNVKMSIPENVQLSQLTSLRVEGAESLSGSGMTRLLSGAPVLEELILLYMEIGDDYNIRSESLKKLHMGTLKNRSIFFRSALRIWAPNLSTLETGGYAFVNDGFSLDVHIPSLTTAILPFEDLYHDHDQVNFEDPPLLGMFGRVFQGICHAQSVTLSKWCIKRLLLLKKKDMSVEFSNAKYLKLHLVEPVDEMLLGVLEMFPKLLTLIVVRVVHNSPPKDGDSFFASEKKIDIPLHHLKTCEIHLSETRPSILRAIEAVLENGEALEKMVLRLLKDDNQEALGLGTLEKVLSMRRSSPKARVIISKDTTRGS